MARGDDIYLLDFWPLDEQNTVGGGATFAWGETEVKLHLGVNRLDDLFQSQTITVPGEELGTREVLFLDRQRAVASARGEQRFALNDETRLKTVLYAEGHGLPGGEVRTPDARTERMPADEGYLLGAEVGVWGFAPQSFANLFVRFATGLAAYDELGVPFGLGTDKRAARARELLVGFSGNVELSSRLALLTGAYGRYFLDADPNVFDRDDVWDVGAAIRPAWFLTEHLHLLAEANVQYLRPNGLSPETGRHEKPLAVSLAVMPALSLGRGSFSRPQLALIYSATLLNEASRLELAAADPARDTAVRHFVGVGVEWWLNSSRYQGGSP
jgi:maltoporin